MRIPTNLLALLLLTICANAQPDLSVVKTFNLKHFTITVSPDIASKNSLDALAESVMEKTAVKNNFQNAKYALLEKSVSADGKSLILNVYDYTKNECLIINTNITSQQVVEVKHTNIQPDPSAEEFEDAFRKVIASDARYSDAYKSGNLFAYRPMPPLDMTQVVKGKAQRTVTVGININNGISTNEIIGVNMITGKIIHYANGAPPTSRAVTETCGIDNARQKTSNKMAQGSLWFTVKKDDTELWKFLATRPAASAGANASGVELQYVSYLGKSVLSRASVPVLNVKYDNDACGPYRDWLYEENSFLTHGTITQPGFIICDEPPQTAIESGSDTGNFRGVAAYETDSDFVLVSETNAGWYRYVMEWHFMPDGTIIPRFEFGAVKNSCVCKLHHHHVYWRFDFDVDGEKNQVEEYNKNTGWHNLDTEIMRLKDSAKGREWKVVNHATGAAYLIVPGENDGIADAQFAIGDIWVLKDNGYSEIDDGIKEFDVPKKIQINKYLNGEDVHNKNVVVWYGAHFTHDVSQEHVPHEVGPILLCRNWPVIFAKNQTAEPVISAK